jgi:hypothetical protein
MLVLGAPRVPVYDMEEITPPPPPDIPAPPPPSSVTGAPSSLSPGWASPPPGHGWVPPPPEPPRSRGRSALILLAVGLIVALGYVGYVQQRTNSTQSSAGRDNSAPTSGEAQKDSNQILADTHDAYVHAASVHVTGTVHTKDGEMDTFDMTVSEQAASGTILVDGHRFDMIRRDGQLYLHGRDAIAFIAGANAAATVGDGWLRLSMATVPKGDSMVLTQLSLGAAQVFTRSSPGQILRSPVKTVDGTEVVPLTAADGELDVTNNGTPFPVQVDLTPQGSEIHLKFSNYNAPYTPKPSPANAVDLSGGGSAQKSV